MSGTNNNYEDKQNNKLNNSTKNYSQNSQNASGSNNYQDAQNTNGSNNQKNNCKDSTKNSGSNNNNRQDVYSAKCVRKCSLVKQKSICEANLGWIFACYWNGVNSNLCMAEL